MFISRSFSSLLLFPLVLFFICKKILQGMCHFPALFNTLVLASMGVPPLIPPEIQSYERLS